MSNRAILELLLELSEEEIEVLYLVCQGDSPEQVAREINRTIKTYHSRMGRVYDKLGYPKDLHWRPKRDKLLNEVRPTVIENITEENVKRWEVFRRDKRDELRKDKADEFVKDLEEQVAQELPPIQSDEEEKTEEVEEEIEKTSEEEVKEVEEEIEEEEPEEVEESKTIRPEDRRRGQESPPPEREERREPRFGCFTRIIIVVIGLAVGIALLMNWLNSRPQTATTVSGQATLDSRATRLAAMLTVEPTVERTIEPTEIITPTITPTAATPTTTPTPTLRPTTGPSPTPESLLFFDDFEHGLSDQWRVISGNPIIANGRLSGDTDTWLMVGDSSWVNYRIELERPQYIDTEVDFDAKHLTVGLHAQNVNNMIGFKTVDMGDIWVVVEGGVETEVKSTYNWPTKIDADRKLSFSVEDNLYVANSSVGTLSSYYDERFQSGGVAILLQERSLEFIRITRID